MSRINRTPTRGGYQSSYGNLTTNYTDERRSIPPIANTKSQGLSIENSQETPAFGNQIPSRKRGTDDYLTLENSASRLSKKSCTFNDSPLSIYASGSRHRHSYSMGQSPGEHWSTRVELSPKSKEEAVLQQIIHGDRRNSLADSNSENGSLFDNRKFEHAHPSPYSLRGRT